MEISSLLVGQEASLRKKIKAYKEVAREIENYLAQHPHDWGKFQSGFNQEVNAIFRDLMLFEKENLSQGREDRVYKLKRIFVEHFRKEFVKGEYLPWSLEKPYGYAGDYKIIDMIYLNDPRTTGLDRLHDNYYQMSAICIAVRNRKEDFKRLIIDFLKENKGGEAKILDLASGPCRDVYELLRSPVIADVPVVFQCYENDERAVEYGKKLLREDRRVKFVRQNAVRIALMKDVCEKIPDRYDLIYSTGLFDYLDYRISVRLIANLRKLLKAGGVLVISDVRDKFSNPSIYFMEWVADWNLIYREDENFRSVFLESGFSQDNLLCRYEQQGIMQYVIARN